MRSYLRRHGSSFSYLNITQFLGALNDNIFKLLLAFFLIDLEGLQNSPRILATAGAIFVAPFLLFSAFGGKLADRFSKSRIIRATKGLEVIAMSVGTLTFYFQMKWGAYAVLFLMATQSAFFSPSKYGIVPELVREDKITKANGLLTSFTYFAMIIGTFLASFLTDVTYRNFIAAGLFCTTIAVIGLITSFGIEHTPSAGSKKKFSTFFLYEIYRTLRRIRQENTLTLAVIGSAYFLFCGAFFQLNLIPYATETLHLTDTQGGYLFLLTALGIGLGGICVSKISGKFVELGVVPIAAVGLVVGCFLIDYLSESLLLTIPVIVLTGIAAGIYLIPLDTFIQVASPQKIRGQVIAAANFLAFIGVLAASGMLVLINDVLGLQADKGFTVFGWITLGWTAILTVKLADYLVRFVGMLMSRIFFELTVRGSDTLPTTGPSILVCYHRNWSDALMVLGAQRQRMHFFIECSKGVSLWVQLQRQFLKITPAPSLMPEDLTDKTLTELRTALKKGQSVCIFLEEHEDRKYTLDELAKLYQAKINSSHYKTLAVDIEKNPKPKIKDTLFYRILRYIRVPASIEFTPANSQ